MDWNDENIERLKAFVADGISYSQIGGELGCTRNAAIGKAKRLGLQQGKNETGGGTRRVIQTRKRVQPMSRSKVVAEEPPPVLDDQGAAITLATVGSKQCRWYVADSSGVDGQLCANPTPAGKPWCDHHRARLSNATAMQAAQRAQDTVPTVKALALTRA